MPLNKAQGLPIIIPLVLYHGPSGRSSAGNRFSSLINGPTEALSAYIPDFSYVLDDVSVDDLTKIANGLSDQQYKPSENHQVSRYGG